MQLTLDHAVARAQAIEGMQRALDHANRVITKWGDLAYVFLEQYARTNLSFISEDVSDASKKWGMAQPPTDRAWGAIYTRALKAGLIEQDGSGRSRRRHGSICPRWKSKIFCVPKT